MQKNKELITLLIEGKDFELLEPFRFYFEKERLAHFAYGLSDFSVILLYTKRPLFRFQRGLKQTLEVCHNSFKVSFHLWESLPKRMSCTIIFVLGQSVGSLQESQQIECF